MKLYYTLPILEYLIPISGSLFSELSNIKLGAPDDTPEYNDISWFVMLFACGMGNGLFFYSVFEPSLLHKYKWDL